MMMSMCQYLHLLNAAIIAEEYYEDEIKAMQAMASDYGARVIGYVRVVLSELSKLPTRLRTLEYDTARFIMVSGSSKMVAAFSLPPNCACGILGRGRAFWASRAVRVS